MCPRCARATCRAPRFAAKPGNDCAAEPDLTPDYPARYGNWIAVGWIVLGIIVTALVARLRPQALEDADRIFVEEEPVGIAGPVTAPTGH